MTVGDYVWMSVAIDRLKSQRPPSVANARSAGSLLCAGMPLHVMWTPRYLSTVSLMEVTRAGGEFVGEHTDK